MLRKYSNSRTLADNIRLGALTAFVAGMVNVASFLIFFSFSSNVTGYFAIMASELVKGNFYQFIIVTIWILAFFFGSFTSNLIVIHFNKRNAYLAHAVPILLEILCLLSVGFYGEYFYVETLVETEILLTLMLFAMGLQNGLTASISNFAVKTTHLTGATTDLAILVSMFTHKEYRKKKEIVGRAKLIASIFISHVIGAILCGILYSSLQFKVFYLVSLFLVIVLVYDRYKLRAQIYQRNKQIKKQENEIRENKMTTKQNELTSILK